MKRTTAWMIAALVSVTFACSGDDRSDSGPSGHGDGQDGSLPDSGLSDGSPDLDGPGLDNDGSSEDTDPPVTTASPTDAPIHQGPLTVTLSVNEPAITRYTVDGTGPNASSPIYSEPIVVDRTLTLRFFSIDSAGNTETPKAERYRIDIVRKLLLDVGSN